MRNQVTEMTKAKNSEEPSGQDKPVSLDPVPFDEAVAALLRVKKPERQGKPKKAQPRKREKRNL